MARRITLGTEAGTRQAGLKEAAQVARAGGVLAVPTESFYALGASATASAAVSRVQAIKGRPDGKPLLVLIARREQVAAFVLDVPQAGAILMQRCWPGPLTIVFPAAAGLPDGLTAGTGTVGLRLSAWPTLQEILCETGPLTGTSANVSGRPPMRTAEEVEAAFGSQVDLILDAGPTPGGAPSTVVTVNGPPQILREGPVSRQQLQAVFAEAGLPWSG